VFTDAPEFARRAACLSMNVTTRTILDATSVLVGNAETDD